MNLRRQAEWEVQASIWMCYPSHLEHWGDKLENMRAFVLKLAKLASLYQDVDLIFNDQNDLKRESENFGASAHDVRFHLIEHNDIWIRDYGPLFVANGGQQSMVKFGFNAWGGKFPPFDLDNKVPYLIAEELKCEIQEYELILEGGSLEFNGNGIALGTKPCLFGDSRNFGKSVSELSGHVKKALNLKELFLYSEGLKGDHTDGHIDNIARFADEKTLLIARARQGDLQFEVCEQLYRESQNLRAFIPDLKIVPIDLPESKMHQGEIMSRSNLNFIFLNGAIIVPTFDEPTDQAALEKLKPLFPSRHVHGFDCRELVLEGGGLHCMTCHQPRVSS